MEEKECVEPSLMLFFERISQIASAACLTACGLVLARSSASNAIGSLGELYAWGPLLLAESSTYEESARCYQN